MQPKTNILTAGSFLLALGTKIHNYTRPPCATARMRKNDSLHLLIQVVERVRKFLETRTVHQSHCPTSPLNLHHHDLLNFRGSRQLRIVMLFHMMQAPRELMQMHGMIGWTQLQLQHFCRCQEDSGHSHWHRTSLVNSSTVRVFSMRILKSMARKRVSQTRMIMGVC